MPLSRRKHREVDWYAELSVYVVVVVVVGGGWQHAHSI
jgi:hypothetical protein